MKDTFSDCHPAVNFIFYTGALAMGMCLLHPVFLCCSFLLSLAYYAAVKKGGLKYIAGMSGVFAALSVINPLFNTRGETVLFTYLSGRPFTLRCV